MIYLIPTPIGNTSDITIRSKSILCTANLIFSEDPRVLHELCKKLEISLQAEIISFGADGSQEVERIKHILVENKSKDIAVVTDAGMPGISDPGHLIVLLAQEIQIPYTVLPGASALITAVAASGIVTQEFTFLGFLPHKKGRQTALKLIQESLYPVVLYESVHRIIKLKNELATVLHPNQSIFVAREMTKVFETYWWGKACDLQDYTPIEKGEFVVVIGTKPKK